MRPPSLLELCTSALLAPTSSVLESVFSADASMIGVLGDWLCFFASLSVLLAAAVRDFESTLAC